MTVADSDSDGNDLDDGQSTSVPSTQSSEQLSVTAVTAVSKRCRPPSVNFGDPWTADRLARASYRDLGSPTHVQDRFYHHLLRLVDSDVNENDDEHNVRYNDTHNGTQNDVDSDEGHNPDASRRRWSMARQSVYQLLITPASTTTRDYSVTVDAFELLAHDPVLGHMLLRYPATLLPLLETAVVHAQRTLLTELPRRGDGTLRHRVPHTIEPNDSSHAAPPSRHTVHWVVKGETGDGRGHVTGTRVHARLIHLPPAHCITSLGNLHARDVGKILQVTGTVVRCSSVQMYESARTYLCRGGAVRGTRIGREGRRPTEESGREHRRTGGRSSFHRTGKGGDGGVGCGRTFVVHADMELPNNALVPPERCLLHCDDGQRCPGVQLERIEGGSIHTDYQEIKIQEAASALAVGRIPRSLLIKLRHDLVDHCQPGDEVVVVGSLLAQWYQAALPGVDCHVGVAMSAHSIRVVQEKGSSAWHRVIADKDSNSVGDHDKRRNEFEAYWQNEAHQANPIQARDFICRAVCPTLYGMQILKLGLLITLIGGVSSDAYREEEKEEAEREGERDTGNIGNAKTRSISDIGDHLPTSNLNEPLPFRVLADTRNDASHRTAFYSGQQFSKNSDRNEVQVNRMGTRPKNMSVKTRRRDQSHLLLVGDPGTGKSQFLRFAAALCPRAVMTTGVGTTSAGLTCAAVRDSSSKGFVLEAGALVLADKGVCCIDEFGCIQDQDRKAIHEAMEQQTLSVAKAGIVCKLNCRATIIAVMNPKDCIYDNQTSLAQNTGLEAPLLSRFDLIFKLIDTSDSDRDNNVTSYLLNRAIMGTGFAVDATGNDCQSLQPWNIEKLRAYIAIVKDTFQPVMTDAAARLLEMHYEKCRSLQSNTIPVTVRFLESMIRLSQAHARLMFRSQVLLLDAVAVIQVMECSAFAYGGFDENASNGDHIHSLYRDPMSIDFSEEADLDFLYAEYRILQRYGMLNCMDGTRLQEAVAMVNVDVASHVSQAESLFENEWQNAGCSSVQGGTPSATQDHYQRLHFSSQEAPTNKKRRW